MTDRLETICGLDDLSLDERDRLRAKLDFIGEVLRRIDRGAGFSEDRGFGWGFEQEKEEGSEDLIAALKAWPILRRLLPRLRHFRHQEKPVIGLGTVPIDDVEAALILAQGYWSLRGTFGEGFGESILDVTFEAECVRASDRTFASDMGDRPFDSHERTTGYGKEGDDAFWAVLEGKLPKAEIARGALLAARMREAIIPCDRCGRTVQHFTIDDGVLTDNRPGEPARQVAIGADELLKLRQALAGHDIPALAALDPAFVTNYDAAADASYCAFHWTRR